MNGLLIEHGRLFDPGSNLDAVGDLLIREGRIAAVGRAERSGAERVIEAQGLLVVPGLMDIHVHLREPGQTHKETIASGTRAAAMGGFAAVACEPNTDPPRDTPERIGELLGLAEQTATVRVLPKCAITLGQQGRVLTDLAALREAGAVAASDDGRSVADDELMRSAMAAAKQSGLPLTLHVDGPEMVERDIGLAAEAEWAVHFSHVSLRQEVELIARARARGLRVSGEATPHHLALCAEETPAHDANFKMNPPLASKADREALRKALAEGVISVIASDHAPHAPEEKAAGYEQAPPGVVGLETTVGVILTQLVHAGLLTLETAVRAMTAGPAAALQMAAPALREGAAAEVTLIDPGHEWTVDPGRFFSQGANCPFAGWRLRGRAVTTIVGGRIKVWEGMMTQAGAAE